MRNSLLMTVAAAALSLAAAGATAQESRTAPGGDSPGASSEAPRGKAENRSERASPRAADRAGGAQGERASGGKSMGAASEDRSNRSAESSSGAKADRASSAQDKASTSDKSSTSTKSSAETKSPAREKSSSTAAGAASSSEKSSAKNADKSDDKRMSRDSAESSTNRERDRSGKSAQGASDRDGEKSGSASATTSTSRSADQDKSRSGATRASSESERNLSGSADRERRGDRNGDAASTRTGSDMDRSASRDRNGREGGDTNIQVRGEFNVDRDRAERVHDRLIRESGQRDTNINISVDIGGRVPDRVRLRPIPRDIVEISSRYRNYEYVVVHDEIVIVEPKTKKVVQIISKGGGRGNGMRHTVNLNDRQRDMLRRDIVTSRTSRDVNLDIDLRAGVRLPDRITLQTFPTDVWEEVPVIKPYRYVVYDRQIILVDPDTREVIDVIR